MNFNITTLVQKVLCSYSPSSRKISILILKTLTKSPHVMFVRTFKLCNLNKLIITWEEIAIYYAEQVPYKYSLLMIYSMYKTVLLNIITHVQKEL